MHICCVSGVDEKNCNLKTVADILMKLHTYVKHCVIIIDL